MGIEEAALHRRVNIVRGIRVSVVPTVLGCPPKDAALSRSLREERQHELEDPAGAEGAMGEIAMIAGADREDAQPRTAPRPSATAGHVTPVQMAAKHPTWISTKPMLEG